MTNCARGAVGALHLVAWDLSARGKGLLGEAVLPLEQLPLGKDLKVNCPLDEPAVPPEEGWVGRASGYIHLRILSQEPDLGWQA